MLRWMPNKSAKLPKVLQVLNPLKEADGDTSSIGVDIRQDNDASISQDLVCLQRRHQLLQSTSATQERRLQKQTKMLNLS